MHTKVHLVATFGPNTLLQPSMQLAALKAHLDAASIPGVSCTTHSAFAGVPWLAWPTTAPATTLAVAEYGEHPFSLLCLTDFEPQLLASNHVSESVLLRRLNRRSTHRHLAEPLRWEHLDRLRQGTHAYLSQRVAPALSPHGLNLVGFTTNFSQVFSAAYVMRWLLAGFPGHRFRFVLGGAAAGLGDTAAALEALGLEAVCVEGEGELKLERMCRLLAALPGDAVDAQVDEALLAAGPGVRRVGGREDAASPQGMAVQVPNVANLPLPDFGDYFQEMDTLAAQGIAGLQDFPSHTMPMEGSRGCFASCAFCSNPHSWSGYRKMDGATVLQRTQEVFARHPFSSVTFMDVVCDTWATQFAQGLLDSEATLPSVMCFRAHHPETFFTRMALCGVVHVQVGVEALSPPLLARMDKGTRVVQNLLAQKYLAELRVTQWNNLITFYPGSTLEDVAETRRVLECTPHFGTYGLSPLCLRVGSPLHDQALAQGHLPGRPHEEADTQFPPPLAAFDDPGVQRMPPPSWLDASMVQAWREFEDWYDGFSRDSRHAVCEMVTLPGQRLRILDHRDAQERILVLEGVDARVLESCHSGPDVDVLLETTRLSRDVLLAALDRLLAQRLLLQTEQRFVALPLRSRDTLVRNFYRQQTRRTAAPGLPLLEDSSAPQLARHPG